MEIVLTVLVILAIVHHSKIKTLRDEVNVLQKKYASTPPAAATVQAEYIRPPIVPTEETTSSAAPTEIHEVVETVVPAEVEVEPKQRVGFEQQFGARLPVWIGGIALALAGFYMVKYSIETGLLSPAVRVVLGALFGGGLLYAAHRARNKQALANEERIGQALSGAGIAVLYIVSFAASNLYHLIPSGAGFVAMAIVTATAVTLSLRHGMPIALLGLVGGFLTPAMIGSSDPSAPALFIYLYMVVAGLLVVARKQQWWLLSLLSIIGAFAWVLAWVFGGHFGGHDGVYLGLFLLAVSATVVRLSRDEYAQELATNTLDIEPLKNLHYVTLAGAVVMMAVVAGCADFGLAEWGLFALLAVGGVVLAYFNQRLYGFVPMISMAVTAVMLAGWRAADPTTFAMILVGFAGLYIASGYILQSRSEKPFAWSGLVAATAIGYFLLAYYRLHHQLHVEIIPLFWGAVAVELAGLASLALKRLYVDIPREHPQRQSVLAIYAATTTAFLSLGLTIELPREFLSVAFALQMAAMAWINLKVDVKSLRTIAGILAAVFAVLLLPQIMLLMQLALYSVSEVQWRVQDSVPIVNWPLFQLGIPAVCFAASAYWLQRMRDDKLVQVLEVATIALIGIMGYYLTRHAFHLDENVLFVKAGFFERTVVTNVLFAYSLGCLWLSQTYARPAIRASALVLLAIALFRVGFFDLLMYNPLWSAQNVGEWPLLNGLLLAYVLPAFWCYKSRALLPAAHSRFHAILGLSMLVLAFVFVTFSVRHAFHGGLMNGAGGTSAETYAYSIVWLVFGIALLCLGTLKKDKSIRVASLLVTLLTVGKVFLYDASELDGLFRVFSFLGLGVCLIGLSWFYTRFVFTRQA